MGGHHAWRNFLFHLFGDCFSETLPEESNELDVCIIDMMQFLAPLIQRKTNSNGQFLNVDEIIHSLLNTAKFYMNNDNNPNVPVIKRSTVLLFDSILNVPKNKVGTQQMRDITLTQNNLNRDAPTNASNENNTTSYKKQRTSFAQTTKKNPSVITNKQELDEDVDADELNEGGGGGDANDEFNEDCILDEDRFMKLLEGLDIISKDYDAKDYDPSDEFGSDLIKKASSLSPHLIVKYDMKHYCPLIEGIDFSTVWRSLNLKWQVSRMITHELLQLDVMKDKVLVIDEGIAIEEQRYEEVRNIMINHHGFASKSLYEKECLVSQLILKNTVQRFMLYHDHSFTRIDQTDIGEADVKLLQYISRGNGAKKFIIVSQDTDLIFILLLHMKRLINPRTKKFDPSQEVWIDSQSPADKYSSHNTPYRYINVIKLYLRLCHFFHTEFENVHDPIELFVFLVNSLKTDFTSPFHKHLRITSRVVWNTFSELHHTPQKGKKNEGFILFNGNYPKDEKKNKRKNDENGNGVDVNSVTSSNTKILPAATTTVSTIKRCVKRSCSPLLTGILNEAIQCQYNGHTNTFNSIINTSHIEKFFFLLCQARLINDLGSMGFSQFQKNLMPNTVPYLEKTSDLFIYANEAIINVNEFIKQQQITSSSFESELQHLPTKPSISSSKKASLSASFKPSLSFTMSPPPQKSSSSTTLTSITINTKKQHDFFKTLSKQDIPPLYGIPSIIEMKARIYRVQWILEYLQNGGLSPRYGKNQFDTSKHKRNSSQWGWMCEFIAKPKLQQYNSSYLASKFNDDHDNNSSTWPLFLFSTKETNNVYDRESAQGVINSLYQ
jgi:hypothetical protein